MNDIEELSWETQIEINKTQENIDKLQNDKIEKLEKILLQVFETLFYSEDPIREIIDSSGERYKELSQK